MAASYSDYNLKTINTKELTDNLKATIEFGGNAMIVGARGTGKTLITKEAIRKSGFDETYLNLSVAERVDVGGLPNMFNLKEGSDFIEYKMPAFFKPLMEGDKKVVALLDEADKAEPSLWAPLLEFLQFRSINGRSLKNLQAVVLTGNLANEGGQRPCLPLLDRCEKYLVQSSSNLWLDWAAQSGEIHASITAFIADNPADLQDEVDPGENYAGTSPRGWHNASKILNFGEEKGWAPRILQDKVAGCIGKKVGIKYASYFDHYQIMLPIIDKIMKGGKADGWDKLEPSRQLVASMITCARLARVLDDAKSIEKEVPSAVVNVAKFINTVDPEMALISIRSQIGLDRCISSGLSDHKDWDDILEKITKRLNG